MPQAFGLIRCSLEHGDNSAIVIAVDEVADGIAEQSLLQSLGFRGLLVAFFHYQHIAIGLGSQGVGTLKGDGILGHIQPGTQGVVAVDDGDGAGVAVGEDGGNGISLNGSDIVAAVVNDVMIPLSWSSSSARARLVVSLGMAISSPSVRASKLSLVPPYTPKGS